MWASRQSDLGLILMAAVVMLISSSAVIWDYFSLLESRQPRNQARVASGLRARAERGEATAQYALGNRYYDGNGVDTNHQEAVAWLEKAAERGHVGAQMALGLCCLRGEGTAQSYEASISWFRKIAAQGDQKGQSYLGLANVGAFGIKRAMTDHFQYLAWLGPLAVAAGVCAAVVGFVRKRKTVFDPVLWVTMVLALGALGWRWRYGDMETLWQNIIPRNSNCYFTHEKLGYALLRSGRVDEASAHFQEAAKLQPDNATAHDSLGYALAMKGQWDEAVIHYQKVVELQPDFADAHNNLGNVLLRKGQLDEAIAHFQQAVKLQPADAKAHYNFGNALLLKGQLNEAVRQYREALRLKPDFAEASDNLASALGAKEAPTNQPTPAPKP